MFRKTVYLLVFVLSSIVTIHGQKEFKRNTIEFSLGQGGSGDALLIKNRFVPIISINYTRKLTKRVGLNAEVLTYTRDLNAGFDIQSINGDPILDIFLNSNSPYQTNSIDQSISNAGVSIFNGINSNHKFDSKILSLSVKYEFPLSKRVSTQLSLGPNLSYNTYKWFSNQATAELTTPDGETIRILHSENKEIRSLTIGNRAKLGIQYSLNDFNIGLRVGNVNFFFLNIFDQDLTFWDTSVIISKNF